MVEADEEKGDRYRQTFCCCIHFHAENGARFIAILGVIFSALSILGSLVFLNRFSVFVEVIHVLLCFCILHAQKILGAVILFAVIALMLVVLVLTPNRKHEEHWSVQYNGGYSDRTSFVLITLGLIFTLFFNIRIIRILYLAYDYMKTKAFREVPLNYNTV